jgi:hypothetical protein
MSEDALSSHEKYLKIYSQVRDNDKKIGQIFNGYSHSRMLSQLSMMQSYGLMGAFPFCRQIREVFLATDHLSGHTQMSAIK